MEKQFPEIADTEANSWNQQQASSVLAYEGSRQREKQAASRHLRILCRCGLSPDISSPLRQRSDRDG
jgi:hypothetical protein